MRARASILLWGLLSLGLGGGAAVMGCGGSNGETGGGSTSTTTNDGGSGGGLPAASIACDVAIVGGGVAGLHTAFRLAPTMGEKVCLFEKEPTLGGRIHDVPLDETNPSSPRFGAGARRVMEGQQVLFDLAAELGLTLETPPVQADFLNARGMYGFAKDDFLPAYPLLMPNTGNGVDMETFLYDLIRLGPARADVGQYPELRSYIREVAGTEEFQFLHDMSRFRADFEYPLDARGYLDYLDEEWDVCCTASYPVGGMSTFIEGMRASATTNEARIFTSEPVSEIRRAEGGYRLVTAKQHVDAQKVVIAVPPAALEHIEGDVVDDIEAQAQFKQIVGVKVVTVTQWWPTAWWKGITDPNASQSGEVWRAWTTEHCLNFIEIPLEPYGAAQKVTRTVYDDDRNCVDFWEALAAQGGTAAVEEEIQRGLEHLFDGNGVSVPASIAIPKPLKTHVQVWPAAWHWLGASAGFTNADIFQWAVEPLPGEDVALVGEAYNVQRSGWSDGAYKSSIHLLNTKYGLDLPGVSSAKSKGPAPKPSGGIRHGGGLH